MIAADASKIPILLVTFAYYRQTTERVRRVPGIVDFWQLTGLLPEHRRRRSCLHATRLSDSD